MSGPRAAQEPREGPRPAPGTPRRPDPAQEAQDSMERQALAAMLVVLAVRVARQRGQALVEFVLVVPLVVLLVTAGIEYAAFRVHEGQWRRGAVAIAFGRGEAVSPPAGCTIVSVEDGTDVLHGVLVKAGLEVGPDVALSCEWHSVTGWLDGPHRVHVPGPVR